MDKLVLMVAFGTLSFLLIWGGMQAAQADNLVDNNVDPITMQVGSTNSDLKVKIVSNTAQSQSGDPEEGCNANDGSPATVNLLISPATGLTYTPNPLTFDYCGNPQKTITFAATIGGTYTITAEVIDTGEGGDSPTDVYHLEPFGTITVIVIDTIPPETTIDSGPATQTAKDFATFTFSSNEASTFECSLDGGAFAACDSGIQYTGLAVGGHTFQVRAIDLSGNVDATPASFTWTIQAVAIAITLVDPDSATWGVPVSVQGTADVVDLTTLDVEINWGDTETTPDIPITAGAWGPISHAYATPGSYTITANLKDGDTVKASATSGVSIDKHSTELTLFMPQVPQFITATTKFLANGTLMDTSANVGLPGRTIEFFGDNEPASTQTGGVTFEGSMNLVSCGSCLPDEDVNEVVGDSTPGDNIVLHLDVGGKIKFQSSTSEAFVRLQDMGTTPFKYKVIEYPDTVQDCDLSSEGIQEECSTAGSAGNIATIHAVSTFVTVNEVRVYDGIKEIIITEVDGDQSSGNVGISAVITTGIDTDPKDQHFIGFEDMAAPSSPSSPLTVNPGSYYAIGVAPNDPADGLSLEAQFAGDTLYEASSSDPVLYSVQANTNGLGAAFAPDGSGTSVTEYACTGLSDVDNDGICDEFESANEIFIDGVSPTVSWTFPAGEGPSTALPDVYYEIDCMSGFCPTAAQLTYIEGRFALENIQLHLMLDQTNLSVCNPLHVWSDSDGSACNDFRSIKENNYGTNAERTQAGGDLGDNKPLFILKSQAVRYLLFAQNIETAGGGPSGIAEFRGNDAVVAVSSIPAAAADVDETIIGTIMHEIGHNLGLLHGGNDDVNCKPNYVSVMNYNRQVPHSKMPVPSVSASTGVGWYGDYSHGNVLLRTSGGALIGDGKTLNEADLNDGNKLTKSGTWKAYDGTTTISSFRLLWGTPTLNTKVQYANTGAQIDWDKDVETDTDLGQQHDTNFLSVTIGGSQLPACTEVAGVFSGVQTSGDDYAIIKNNIAKFNGASSALLAILTPAAESNPNSIPEANSETIAQFGGDYQFLGVENPLNNVGFGEPGIATSKKGNTIHVRFNFNDANGTPITGDNIQSYEICTTCIIMQVARVTSSEPPADEEYFKPDTSTQPGSADFFTWDGSKWGFQWGTKTLSVGTYAARIYVVQETGEGVVLDHNGDGISFLVTIVKN